MTMPPPMSPTTAPVEAPVRSQSRRVTSYDVANLAGVSQSAVSRCFKPGASVSKATVERVMQAARTLGYTPNAATRSLAKHRSNQVALFLPDLAAFHDPEMVSDMSRQFARHGLRIVLFPLQRESDLDATLENVWQHQVDGAVVAARLNARQVAEFERRGLPFVLFNRNLDDSHVNAVLCDQVQAARTIVSRLAAGGHKRFAMLEGTHNAPLARERSGGVRARLAELGLGAPLVVSGCDDYASGGRGLREIVARMGGLPDAIICGNDVTAIGCVDTARHEMRIEVPRMLSVTGFDGVGQASWLSYNLTTLRQPLQLMTAAASDMLAGLIRDKPAGPERRVFSACVVEGGTARLGPAF